MTGTTGYAGSSGKVLLWILKSVEKSSGRGILALQVAAVSTAGPFFYSVSVRVHAKQVRAPAPVIPMEVYVQFGSFLHSGKYCSRRQE